MRALVSAPADLPHRRRHRRRQEPTTIAARTPGPRRKRRVLQVTSPTKPARHTATNSPPARPAVATSLGRQGPRPHVRSPAPPPIPRSPAPLRARRSATPTSSPVASAARLITPRSCRRHRTFAKSAELKKEIAVRRAEADLLPRHRRSRTPRRRRQARRGRRASVDGTVFADRVVVRASPTLRPGQRCARWADVLRRCRHRRHRHAVSARASPGMSSMPSAGPRPDARRGARRDRRLEDR